MSRIYVLGAGILITILSVIFVVGNEFLDTPNKDAGTIAALCAGIGVLMAIYHNIKLPKVKLPEFIIEWLRQDNSILGAGLIIFSILMFTFGDLLHGFFHHHTIETSSHLMDENGNFSGCSSIQSIRNWGTGIFFVGVFVYKSRSLVDSTHHGHENPPH